ncbi:glycoside hydrolase superfamily [Phascolomyces articulosus]|uniref:beta-N-acetylhexosaminidase n=1 Tax=Phascolomyces articulosus TaxID=60185 RepID=A0AAD5JQM0_9FUNG|nr:glycoside hydrolase superfamily [Phascolomyces articulosus]
MTDYDLDHPQDQIMSSAYNDMISLHVVTNHVVLLIHVPQLPVEIQDGVSKIIKYAPHKDIVDESNGMQENFSNNVEYLWHVQFAYDQDLHSGELIVSSNYASYNDVPMGERFEIYVRYHRKIEAFRAIGRLLGAARDLMVLTGEHGALVNFTEQNQFDTQGVMVDCSRNGVLRLASIHTLLCNMALMGLNMLQLYTEDTYEVDGEPLFGYLRGRYNRRELTCIDDYAFDLGIEVVPCIQTLGHLGQILQWPHYAYLRDNTEVLLAESEATYDFIEKIIQTAASPFRSKRIHLGMDEAHGVGEERYRQLFGYKEPTRIFVDHLQKVNEICTRLGLQPMIWSDTAKNNTLQGYYDENNNPAETSSDLVESIPSNMELVYWDYYHTSTDLYTQKLQQHRELGCQQPWMANAAWTWSRFWTALPFTFESVRASTVVAKNRENGVRNTFITIWGDEGNECDVFSAFPALCYYAEHGYCTQEEVNVPLLKRNFEGICGATFDDWVFASKIDDTPSGNPITVRTHYMPNISKWLLWEDPFLSFLSPQYAEEDLETHYGSIAAHLFDVMDGKNGRHPMNERLELPARIASVLALKCHLRQRLVEAYRHRDYQRLYDLAQGRLTRLREEVELLWRYHRSLWMKMYKPFGWEVLELRYGGLRTRLETMYDHIVAHVQCMMMRGEQQKQENSSTEQEVKEENGEEGEETKQRRSSSLTEEVLDEENVHWRIPEFDTDLECLYYGSRTNLLLDYSRVISPSRPG